MAGAPAAQLDTPTNTMMALALRFVLLMMTAPALRFVLLMMTAPALMRVPHMHEQRVSPHRATC
jgi:hypothetical protein